MIQTVTGPISQEALGFCQSHEHLLLSKGTSWEQNPSLWMDDLEKSLLELQDYRAAGGCSIVDAQPVGCSRMPEGLLSLSQASGVSVIASTGFHKACYYPQDHWIHKLDADALAEIFRSELTQGMYVDCDLRTPEKQIDARAGIIKAALDSGSSPLYEKLFSAAAQTQRTTDAPLMIHVEKGSDPMALLEKLCALGVPAERMIFCHMDRACSDLSIHAALLSRGAYLEYDTIGRPKYHSDDHEIEIMKAMIRQGYEDRLLFSLDTTRERMKRYTPHAVGLTYILLVFLDRLRAAGVSEGVIEKLSNQNCRRAFSFACP